jgi:hypothetical protein
MIAPFVGYGSGPYLSRQAMATFIGPLMARSPAS